MKTKRLHLAPFLLGIILTACSCTIVRKSDLEKKNEKGIFALRLENDETSLTMDVHSSFDSPSLYAEDTDIKSLKPYSYVSFDDSAATKFSNIHNEYTDTSIGETTGGLSFYKFTFFLKNTGQETNSYYLDVKLKDDKNIGYDEYLRVMVFEGLNKQTVYAKRSNITSGVEKEKITFDEASELAELFNDKEDIINISNSLDADENRKYTMLFWLEGSDPECKDLPDNIYLNVEVNIKGYK